MTWQLDLKIYVSIQLTEDLVVFSLKLTFTCPDMTTIYFFSCGFHAI